MKSSSYPVPSSTAAELPFEISLQADTPEFMAPAYYGCLHWAVKHKGILAAFEEETGTKPPPPRTPIEKMVDTACGHDPNESFIRAFLQWFNENIWGGMDNASGEA
jgi:hypothetical protein